MDNKQYKYDAFISYRHCDLDKFVAENLHRILESYELPKNIKEKLNIQGRTIKRIFRDQDELPLSSNLEDPIIDALNNSKYLIVICSPRLKDSLWCKKEIETFKKIRGRKNIFCVLVEGEPKDSFPEAVLFDEKEVKQKNGKIKKEKVLIEPLAADVRGENKKEVLSKIKEEKLRLIAPMYNLDYDDLKQRHRAQKVRKMIMTSVIVSIACLLFALYSSFMFIKIYNQQKLLKKHQALSLANDSYDALKEDRRYDAIKNSYEALTKFEGVKMPYTAEAEYALSRSLGVYNTGSSYKAITDIKTKGVVDYIKSSYDNKYLAIYDESEEITLWDANKLKKISTYSDISGYLFEENDFTFIGNDYFAYINKDGNIIINNNKDGKKIDVIKKDKESFSSIKGSENNYLSYIEDKTMTLYNVKDKKTIGNYKSSDKLMREIYYSEDGKYVFVSSTNDNYSIDKEDYLKVHVFDTDSLNEVNSIELNAGYISGMLTKDNNVYMLLNRTFKNDFNMLVVSYNYIDNELNWSKTYDGNWGKYISKSYAEGTNEIAVVNSNKLNVFDASNGELIETFDMKGEIIKVYSYYDKDIYLVFNNDGSVNYVSMESRNNVEFIGKYELNLDKYITMTKNDNGFLIVPQNENRVIYYEANSNKSIKKENIKLDYVEDDSYKIKDIKKLKKEYNVKNKNLVSKMFYSKDKRLLFVSYTDDSFAVYDTKEKKLLNMIDDVVKANHYYGKDKYGRIYIGNISDAYILDKDYNKVGYIKGLNKIDNKNNRVIVSNNEKYYSLPIYNLKDLLKKAKDYLN